MLTLLRFLLGIPKPKVTRSQALECAQRECECRGWEFVKPRAIPKLRSWMIWVNGNWIGGPWVIVDNQTGDVLRFGVPPR